MSIEFIYFDLGKVILDFDHAKGCQAIASLTGRSSAEVDQALFGSGLEDQFETGAITPSELHRQFCETLGITDVLLDEQQLMRSMSDIFSPNQPMFALIAQLRAVNHRLGILSNTCVAHWEFVTARYRILDSLFGPKILSYEARSMKPDRKIYERAIDASGTAAASCFFVDDKPENVEGAIAAGLDAVLYQSVGKLAADLQLRGVGVNF